MKRWRWGMALLMVSAGCAHVRVPLPKVAVEVPRADGDDALLTSVAPAGSTAATYLRAHLARDRGHDGEAFAGFVDVLRRHPDAGMAVAAAHVLDDLATEVGRPADEERALAAITDPLPAEARFYVLRARAKYARLRGADDEAEKLLVAGGALGPWRVAGPVGNLPRLDLLDWANDKNNNKITEQDKSLKNGHTIEGARVAVVLESPSGQPGILLATTEFTATTPHVVLRVESEQPWLAYVDEQLVARAIDEYALLPRVQVVALPLAVGRHRLRFAVAGSGRAELDVALLSAGADVASAASTDEVAALVAADLAQQHGSPDARALAETLIRRWPKSGMARLALALVEFEDPSRPSNLAHDLARRTLLRALSADAELYRARDLLVLLELSGDRPRQALALLDGAPRAAQDVTGWRPALLRYQAFRARGWKLEEGRALDEAVAKGGATCTVLDEELSARRERHDVARVRELAVRRRGCGGGNTDLAEALRDASDLAGALAEYRRLLTVDPEDERWRWGLAETLVQDGDLDEATTLLAALVAAHPRRTNYRRLLADAWIARHRPDRARAVVEEGLAEEPENLELARSLEALCAGRRPCGALDALRVDGKTIIADYVARHAGHPAATPAEIVLDRTVTRVFPAGGRLTLTHNIIAVFDKDGLEKWGEVQIPAGADVLTLRTIKADGTTREPEDIAGKATISAPDLEVGDFVEFEYVEPAAPPGAFSDGFLTERFYFRSADAPLDRSEFLLVTPTAMKIQTDARGGAPTAVVVDRGDGTTLRTFATRLAPELFIEPSATPFQEDLPSVRVAAGVSMARWRDYLRDQSFGADRPNAELSAVAKSETAHAHSDGEKLAALDRWVRRNIRGSGRLDEAATVILARKEGNRERVLSALLHAVGVDSTLAIARPVTAPRLGGALPDLESYDQGLLYVDHRFIDSRYKHSPTGFLVPALRGGEALLLGGGPVQTVTLPTTNDDDRAVTLVGHLDGSGAAQLEVKETLRGWPALEWREALEKLSPDRLRPEFEQHTLGFYFPGSTLLDLSWSGADGDDGPFVVRYRFRAPQLGRVVGDALVLPAPFPALLARRYVTVAARTSALHIDYAAPTSLTAQIALPDGLDVVLPSPVRLDGFGRFAQAVQQRGRTLYLDASFALPDQRVAPDRYGAFVDYAAAVDRAESRAAELRPTAKKAQN